MSLRVYSAARAFYPLHGKSSVEAWKVELTAMFNPNALSPRSFILKHHRLECIRRSKEDDISIGDVFKYEYAEMCVKIVECTPYQSFAYDEGGLPAGERFIDEDFRGTTRMEFFLKSYPGGTSVEIRRRKKGYDIEEGGTFLQNVLNQITNAVKAKYSSECRTNPAQFAAEDLQLILARKCVKGDEIRHGDIIIKRDDSYRINF